MVYMADVEHMKRKAESLSLSSPRSAKLPKMEEMQETPRSSVEIPASMAPVGDSNRGNVTIIHAINSGGKQLTSRMQWTFPRSYLAGRTRSVSPQQSPRLGGKSNAELNTASLQGTFTPDAIAVFYDAITKEQKVLSSGHTLHEYCQIYALAQFFGVHNIFHDGEGNLLRRVMGDDTSLDNIKTASGLASVFRWRALVERCRFLLSKRIAVLEADLKTMNCGGLNVLASKLDEVYDFLLKSGFVNPTAVESKSEQRREC
jgi:hypothetical protein